MGSLAASHFASSEVKGQSKQKILISFHHNSRNSFRSFHSTLAYINIREQSSWNVDEGNLYKIRKNRDLPLSKTRSN